MRWCPVMLLLLFPSLAVAWPVGGARLTGAFDEQVGPEIMADGSGGAYVSWADWRDFIASQSNLSDLYMQHVTSSGDIAPGWPMDGLRIAGGSGTQGSVWRMAPDGVGGVLIVFGDTRVDFGDLYLQRITASGEVAAGWLDGGIPLGVGPGATAGTANAPTVVCPLATPAMPTMPITPTASPMPHANAQIFMCPRKRADRGPR